jgi:hypothetical protein
MPNDRNTGREAETSPQVAVAQSVTGGAPTLKAFFKKLLDHENLFMWVTAGISFGLLCTSVMLRGATGGKWKITLDDAAIAAIALGLCLVITGRIRKIVVGKEGVTLETAEKAIRQSAGKPIAQVTGLPLEAVVVGEKEMRERIPELIQNRTQALKLVPGRHGYHSESVLKEYLKTLIQYDFFRFVIFLKRDDTLFGIINARNLWAKLNESNSDQPPTAFANFVNRLNGGTDEDLRELAGLPGFVSVDDAATTRTVKSKVLKAMDLSKRDWLPVVNQDTKFVGIVDRSRLIGSMILDITNSLDPGETESRL